MHGGLLELHHPIVPLKHRDEVIRPRAVRTSYTALDDEIHSRGGIVPTDACASLTGQAGLNGRVAENSHGRMEALETCQ